MGSILFAKITYLIIGGNYKPDSDYGGMYMKTLKTIIVTMAFTILVGAIGITAILFDQGIVTIQEKSTGHNKQVYIDGELAEETFWDELLGYTVRIDVVDEAYIGK